MVIRNWALPLLLLALILFIKCKDSVTQAPEPSPQVPPPALVAPKTNSNQSSTITLQWDHEGNAESFEFRLSESKDFKTALIDSTVDSTKVTVKDLPRDTTIFWTVRANMENEKTQWSETRHFKTIDLAPPAQVAPSGKATDVALKPTFKWKPVKGADRYQLDASHGDQRVIHKQTDKTSFSPAKALSAETSYYWRVRALKGKGKGKWSEVHSFTTAKQKGNATNNRGKTSLAAPAQVAPSGKAKDVAVKPHFKWKAVDGAKAYELNASHGDKRVIEQKVDKTGFTPGKALSAEQTYQWRVRALDGETKGPWSPVHSFTTAPSTWAVRLKSPDDGAFVQPTKLSLNWHSLKQISQYRIQVAFDKSFPNPITDKKIDGNSYKLNELSNDRNYYWRVKPVVANQKTEWSQVRNFKTAKLAVPEQVAPAGKAKDVAVKPHFKWKAVDGAKAYELNASHGDKRVIEQKIDKTGFTPGKALSAEQTYQWRVRALDGETKGRWSPVHSFTTATTAPSTSAVRLKSPDDGAFVEPTKLSLNWHSLKQISQYRIQVALDNSFPNPITDKKIDGNSYKLNELSNDRNYYWRVQAVGDGDANNWSKVRSFHTKVASDKVVHDDSRRNTGSDRQALMDLYKATDGDHWSHNRGWGSKRPLNSWYGIKAKAGGRVTRIDLWRNNLKGHLPKSIGNLDKVKYLNVKNNHLTGVIPPEIGDMASLEWLVLQGFNRDNPQDTHFKEPPKKVFRSYHPGKTITNTNDLEGQIPGQIGQLSNLKRLEISNAPKIKGPIPPEIGKLTKLEGLYLSFDDFSGTTLPAEIGNLTNLKQLYIAGAQLEGNLPKSFENLTQLRFFNLGQASNHTPDNHLTGRILDFSRFTELREIVMTYNKLSGKYPHYWNNGNFKHLNTLRFSWNKLTGTLHSFDKLPRLKSLGLEGNDLSGPVDKQILTLPRHIRIIGLGWNDFTGKLPQSGWPDFTQVKTVYLNGNHFKGRIPCDFWNKITNRHLQRIYINANEFDSNCTDALDKLLKSVKFKLRIDEKLK